MREAVVCTVLLDLQKAYDALDRDRCLDVLAGCGVGPRTPWLLWTYWIWLWVIAKADG